MGHYPMFGQGFRAFLNDLDVHRVAARLDLGRQAAQVGDVADSAQDCVSSRAALDAAARPELDLRDRAVGHVEIVLPRVLRGEAERPSQGRADSSIVRHDGDPFAKMPFHRLVEEIADSDAKLSERLSALDTPVLRMPYEQVGPFLVVRRRVQTRWCPAQIRPASGQRPAQGQAFRRPGRTFALRVETGLCTRPPAGSLRRAVRPQKPAGARPRSGAFQGRTSRPRLGPGRAESVRESRICCRQPCFSPPSPLASPQSNERGPQHYQRRAEHRLPGDAFQSPQEHVGKDDRDQWVDPDERRDQHYRSVV